MLRNDCEKIYTQAINACSPDNTVIEALEGRTFSEGKLILVSVGKAAWQMASTASTILKNKITNGIVITKYGYSRGDIPNITVYEAGHPIPDESSILATNAVLEMTKELTSSDTVIFLVSGGGSALFESIDFDLCELQSITRQLLSCAASIDEINVIRKHLSKVKGGKFAQHCFPAKILCIVLSDVLSNRLDVIASGPTYPDSSTSKEAINIVEKYQIDISASTKAALLSETPKNITNAEHIIGKSVIHLCEEAVKAAAALGYKVIKLTDKLDCQAREAGKMLATKAKLHSETDIPLAFVAAGETVVQVKGHGKGGRNQEIALSAAKIISNIDNVAVFSVGSDGTDGPTDAAGGYADGKTWQKIISSGHSPVEMLDNNDSYHALALSDGLIFTGPTGTNVNDISIALIRPTN